LLIIDEVVIFQHRAGRLAVYVHRLTVSKQQVSTSAVRTNLSSTLFL